MPFREKSAWISVLSMSAIYGFYFWSLAQAGPHASALRFGGLLQTIIALVLVQIVLTVAAAIFTPRDAKAPRDERETLIELKSARVAYVALAGCVVLACFWGALDPQVRLDANALLFILVACEILHSVSRIVYFRLSA